MDNASCESPSPENYTVPIVGYEIVEKRDRFTVCMFKIVHVQYFDHVLIVWSSLSD